MKIAYVANVRMPTEKAHGVQIMQMCRAFAQNGHEVTLVVPGRRNAISQSPWEFYGLEPNFRIIHVPIVNFIPWDKWLGNLALWLETFWFGWAARRVVESLEPDVVYTREALLAPFLPERALKVFEAHDFPKSHPRLYRRFWRCFDRVVALTAGLRDRFVAVGYPPERLVVAHDAVDPERFVTSETKEEARRALDLPPGFLAVYVGGLYPQKGTAELVAAAERLHGKAHIAIVGGTGELLEAWRRQVTNRKLHHVLLPGARPHAEVTRWLRAADVVVLPNRGGDAYSERYTSPLKLFEYLAAGKAIVATDLPTVREILDEETAEIVRPNDPKDLADGIECLRSNPERRHELEARALQLAQRHTWRSRAEEVLAGLPKAPVHQRSFWHRHLGEIVITLLALVIRTAYVAWWPQVPVTGGDGPYYLRLADIIRGLIPAPTDQPLFFAPVYPYLLAVIRSLLGENLLWVRLAQAVMSAATVLVAMLMTRRWVNRGATLMVGVVGAFYVPMIIESGIIYTETTYTLLLTLAVFLFLRMLESRKTSAALLAGLGFILAGLTREVGFYLAYLLAFFVALRQHSLKVAVVFIALITLFLGAWSWRNHLIAQNFSGVAVPVLAKNYQQDLVSVSRQKFFWSHVYLLPEGFVRFFQFPYHLSDIGSDQSAKAAILSRDWPVLKTLWPEILAKIFLTMFHWLLLALALIGLIRGRLERHVRIALGLLVGLMALMTVAISMNSYDPIAGYGSMARFRFTVEPLILVLAAAGAEYLAPRLGPKRNSK